MLKSFSLIAHFQINNLENDEFFILSMDFYVFNVFQVLVIIIIFNSLVVASLIMFLRILLCPFNKASSVLFTSLCSLVTQDDPRASCTFLASYLE